LLTALGAKANLAGGNTFTGAQTITGTAAGSQVLTLTGASGQTADLLRAPGGARIPAAGNYFIAPGMTVTYSMDINAGGAAIKPLVVKGAASQTASLQEWQNSSGTILASVSSGGTFSNAGNILAGTTTALGRITSVVVTPTVVGLAVRGAASQTANLQEWQNSAGSILASVNSLGGLYVVSGLAAILTANSGATLELTRMTAAAGNPGANKARIFFRDGTNAGTLKLVVRAGAAGAETTILDNIPQ
jgi:hypothetical protein